MKAALPGVPLSGSGTILHFQGKRDSAIGSWDSAPLNNQSFCVVKKYPILKPFKMVPFFGKNHFLNEFSSDFLLSLLKRKGGEDTDSSLTYTQKKISAYRFVLCFCNKVGVPECNTKLRDTTNLYLMDLNKKVVTI